MNAEAQEEVVRLFQQGNAPAFELLFEHYRLPIFNFVYRMLNGDREAAEDLLSEIFMKLHDAREFYEPKAKFSTWLFTIARNHCLNRIKSRIYRQGLHTISLEALAQNTNGPATPDRLMAPSVADDSRRADMRELLDQAIAGLPDEYKEVFVLHAVEGFPHEEVAQILKMNPATVRTNYHRARQWLREKIGKQF
ncbi:MAG: RNA polymerase sigma factor [Verrucomicrobia bacterium]|nr:RNA polymerase sigma factor [Verrucomicrobiota bacterium]MCG2680514.1 RNA polymerase sigma factor [Kiritimatiellia bacterium]MBU4248237.1 RNA polymerase sigma factor [Verrucomicrobiota bacterium]MBU4290440.1 RNA polymerase sigma factor [Verrucomicrobiota bacterium]MBU4428854.1 RNA polymerase sigma factor [Verrucomicrobiota bacterium]